MGLRIVSWALLIVSAFAGCDLSEPDFIDDHGLPSVRVAVVQAPLLSAFNKLVGDIDGLLRAYHTGLIFFQQVDGHPERQWTLEFDGTVNTWEAMWPEVSGENITWAVNDARWCLSHGILWGEGHWKKMNINSTAMQVSARQIQGAFRSLVTPRNATAHGLLQYSLWNVAETKFPNILGQTMPETRDVTCGDGPTWFLYDMIVNQNASLIDGFNFKTSHAQYGAHRLELVDTSDLAQWSKVLRYYRYAAMLKANVSVMEKFWGALHVFPDKYIYDRNYKRYYKLIGNRFPWIRVTYTDAKLCSPPFWGVPECLDPVPTLV